MEIIETVPAFEKEPPMNEPLTGIDDVEGFDSITTVGSRFVARS